MCEGCRIPKHKFRDYSAAHRMYETMRLHQMALSTEEIMAGRFVAIRLADGGSDNRAYESRADAVENSRNSPSRHGYYQVPLESMGPEVCDTLLWYVRAVYDAGHREDPAHALIIPTRLDDM